MKFTPDSMVTWLGVDGPPCSYMRALLSPRAINTLTFSFAKATLVTHISLLSRFKMIFGPLWQH